MTRSLLQEPALGCSGPLLVPGTGCGDRTRRWMPRLAKWIQFIFNPMGKAESLQGTGLRLC